MKIFFLRKSVVVYINVLFVIFLISACDKEDSVQPQENHFEAVGTIIYDATGAVAVSILRGVTGDTLFAEAGLLSDHFTVKFYDDNETVVNPPDDEDHYLGFEIGDPSVAETYQHPGEEGGYEFHLRGLKTGSTEIELFVYHIDHRDYRSGKIPVIVK